MNHIKGEPHKVKDNAMTQKPELDGPDSPHFNLQDPESNPAAWEEVEAGRFMPKRIRGSCQGRALG
jgi:hypothetical protein